MPTDFELVAGAHTPVDIILPPKFNVIGAVDFYGNPKERNDLPLDTFKKFIFHFLISEENEIEFVAQYNLTK